MAISYAPRHMDWVGRPRPELFLPERRKTVAKKPAKREVIVYKDANGEWRWQIEAARGGRILADSGEGYKRRGSCLKMAQSLFPKLGIVIES